MKSESKMTRAAKPNFDSDFRSLDYSAERARFGNLFHCLIVVYLCLPLLPGCSGNEPTVSESNLNNRSNANQSGNSEFPISSSQPDAAHQDSKTIEALPELSFGRSPDDTVLESVTSDASSQLTSTDQVDTPENGEGVMSEAGQNNADQHDDGFLPQRRLGQLELVQVDVDKTVAAGLVVTESEHLRLIHEPGSKGLIADFHTVFNQAVPQWIRFFNAPEQRFANWKVTCFFIVDLEKFQRAGLIPDAKFLPNGKLPPGGWEFGNQIWVNQHPGEYYNRHMLLHEGTHAFCFFNFGNLGLPWLAEGLAEHLAVHRWKDQTLTLAARVSDKNNLEYWGRVKLIQDAWFDGQPKSLGQVMEMPPSAFPATESYAWSWAAVMLFDRHPELHSPFHEVLQSLPKRNDSTWNKNLLNSVELNIDQLNDQWDVMVGDMVYGYDVERAYVHWQPKDQAQDEVESEDSFKFELPVDGAWYETPYLLPAGSWKVTADGLFQIGTEEEIPLTSTTAGISLQYFHGARIGQLQAAIKSQDGFFVGSSSLTKPIAISPSGKLETSQPGRLLLRINDHPAHLRDNIGKVIVEFLPAN